MSFSRREPIICNFCGISGHTSSVCRKRLRSNPSRNVNFRQNYDRTTNNQQNRTNSDCQSLSTSADNVNSSIRTADVLSLPKVKIYLDNVGLSALLDSGSGRSFINKQMADNLNLKLRHCDIRCSMHLLSLCLFLAM